MTAAVTVVDPVFDAARRAPARQGMLPARLSAVLGLVPEGDPVADIGSGHGALALALAARGQRVVATERTAGTMAGLAADIARGRAGPGPAASGAVVTRRGDGVSPLAPGEVATAVIAGMGARSIVRILDSAPWLPPCLVLQPIQEPELVREWIEARGWPATHIEVMQRRRTYHAWRVHVPAALSCPEPSS